MATTSCIAPFGTVSTTSVIIPTTSISVQTSIDSEISTTTSTATSTTTTTTSTITTTSTSATTTTTQSASTSTTTSTATVTSTTSTTTSTTTTTSTSDTSTTTTTQSASTSTTTATDTSTLSSTTISTFSSTKTNTVTSTRTTTVTTITTCFAQATSTGTIQVLKSSDNSLLGSLYLPSVGVNVVFSTTQASTFTIIPNVPKFPIYFSASTLGANGVFQIRAGGQSFFNTGGSSNAFNFNTGPVPSTAMNAPGETGWSLDPLGASCKLLPTFVQTDSSTVQPSIVLFAGAMYVTLNPSGFGGVGLYYIFVPIP